MTYWRCRRSLCLWPNPGPNLEHEVRRFLLSNLEIDLEAMEGDAGSIKVRRVVEPRWKIKEEAIVEFSSAPIRDSVKGSGFKLEGKEAGIRFKVPNFSKSDFQVLQLLSYKMKQSNGEMKRSLKFDDESLGLVLDVQLPGEEWTRFRPDQARLARQNEPALRSGPRELSVDRSAGFVRSMVAPTLAAGPPPGAASGSDATPLGRRDT